MFSKQQFTINARGITPSLRKAEDGISIFGVDLPERDKTYNPDVKLNVSDEKKMNILLEKI